MKCRGQIQFFAPFLNLDGSFGGSNVSSELLNGKKKHFLSQRNTNYVNFWQFQLNFNERHSKFKSELSRASDSNRENDHVAVFKNALKSYEKILTGLHHYACPWPLKTQFWTTMASYFQKDFPIFLVGTGILKTRASQKKTLKFSHIGRKISVRDPRFTILTLALDNLGLLYLSA